MLNSMTTLNITPKAMAGKKIPSPIRAVPTMRPSRPNVSGVLPQKMAIMPRRVLECLHVDQGAVWCSDCANAHLAFARKEFAKSNELNVGTIETMKEQLRTALHEYSMTPEGIRAIEQSYVNLSASNPVEANKLRLRADKVRKEASSRNQKAREETSHRKAREATVSSIPVRYVPPPRDADGRMTTSDVVLRTTHHSVTRMDEREIPFAKMLEALRSPVEFHPQGRGRWKIIGANDIALCGFFEKHPQRVEFVIVTTYYMATGVTPTVDAEDVPTDIVVDADIAADAFHVPEENTIETEKS